MGVLSRIAGALRKRVARFRSAITGRFVSRTYAEKHPDTTVRERD